ncbi:cytochrome c1-2, heme protein, mitochondrial-like [Diprion similis]|uniref:cytochrome c1-2, heme protein, mitochondrial-like n=1 Tax=Diprion similis TaxID=362088 RepID=UPI001EF98F2A|nr:cytochrome c1-2, heme protein, mitochondrial-like [Diprion similis]
MASQLCGIRATLRRKFPTIGWRFAPFCKLKRLRGCFGLALGVLGAFGGQIYASDVSALIDVLRPPSYPWDFNGIIATLDHASIRRGWEVYKTVCSECHSAKYLAFRELIGVTHTEQEAKALAEAVEIKDGPDENGEMFTRPGRLSDCIPPPFPNEEAARAANNGAFPPDLTYVINARHDGQNYLFSLLTGWSDPPAGVTLEDGQSFNAYFPGGAIGMGQIIDDGAIEFEDGTYASQSQIAKDVVTFLTWTANPEFDTRKLWLIKSTGILLILLISVSYLTRFKFSSLKSRKIYYLPRK